MMSGEIEKAMAAERTGALAPPRTARWTPVMRPTSFRSRSPWLLAIAGLLVASSCGSGGSSDDATAGGQAGSTTLSTSAAPPDTDPEPDASIDACSLLPIEALAAAASGTGESWVQGPPSTPGTCSWGDGSTTVSVEVFAGIDETIDPLGSTDDMKLTNIEVGGSAMTGIVDLAAERYHAIYVAAGLDSVIKVTQVPPTIGDEQLIGLGQAAADRFETAPPG